jgi:hypothetical protein
MPYVCDNSRLNWTDDDEAIPPKASDFVYVKAKELGGPSSPAKLSIPTGTEPNNSEEFENPQEARAMHLALKACGVIKVYCRYDGGNDEGFAWVEYAELGGGERLDMTALAKRLIANGVSPGKRMPWQRDWPDERVVQDMLDFPLAVNWAAALLGGRGFGTGNYSMYGAFAVDLVMETITDDPKANPVVRNIEIDGIRRAPSRFELAEIMKGHQVEGPPLSVHNIGDRVVHANFGSGTVAAVEGNRLTIIFDSGQTMRIIDNFVDRE